MSLLELAARPRGIGLLMILAGLAVLLARTVYDIAAEMTQARREYRIMSANGLISGSEAAQKDSLLADRIEKSRKTRVTAKNKASDAFKDGSSAPESTKQNASPAVRPEDQNTAPASAGAFATISLDHLNTDGKFYEPADRFDTVSLER